MSHLIIIANHEIMKSLKRIEPIKMKKISKVEIVIIGKIDRNGNGLENRNFDTLSLR